MAASVLLGVLAQVMADPLARSCDRERINSFGAERRRSSIVVLFVLVDRGGWFVAQLSTRIDQGIRLGSNREHSSTNGGGGGKLPAARPVKDSAVSRRVGGRDAGEGLAAAEEDECRCAVVVGHGAPGYSLKAESTFARHLPPPLSAPGRESELRITPGSQRVRRASRCCCRRSARKPKKLGGGWKKTFHDTPGATFVTRCARVQTFVTRCARVRAVSSSAAPSSGRLLRNRTREIPGTAYERCAEKRRRLGDGFPWEALRRAELTTQRGSGSCACTHAGQGLRGERVQMLLPPPPLLLLHVSLGQFRGWWLGAWQETTPEKRADGGAPSGQIFAGRPRVSAETEAAAALQPREAGAGEVKRGPQAGQTRRWMRRWPATTATVMTAVTTTAVAADVERWNRSSSDEDNELGGGGAFVQQWIDVA
ncbi:unnamed protein product [Lampetra fluviatilis]